mmetsp:Transcript_11480/g.26157  ORF Transcript_11480/g.26157 Transcript_11480/m.26157 type:complete len:86 (+) Transcript_11480:1875-2132(+)
MHAGPVNTLTHRLSNDKPHWRAHIRADFVSIGIPNHSISLIRAIKRPNNGFSPNIRTIKLADNDFSYERTHFQPIGIPIYCCANF